MVFQNREMEEITNFIVVCSCRTTFFWRNICPNCKKEHKPNFENVTIESLDKEIEAIGPFLERLPLHKVLFLKEYLYYLHFTKDRYFSFGCNLEKNLLYAGSPYELVKSICAKKDLWFESDCYTFMFNMFKWKLESLDAVCNLLNAKSKEDYEKHIKYLMKYGQK